MNPKEREQAIYKAVEQLVLALHELKVETSIIAIAIDESPLTGYGTSRVNGNAGIVAQQIATAAGSLPTPEFFALMTALATSPVFAKNRGEDPESVPPIDPKLVN